MLPVPSEANRLKLPPSDTAKFTLASALLLCRAASKEAATPSTQKLSTVVFQMPPLSAASKLKFSDCSITTSGQKIHCKGRI